jgi:hypothetical protein
MNTLPVHDLSAVNAVFYDLSTVRHLPRFSVQLLLGPLCPSKELETERKRSTFPGGSSRKRSVYLDFIRRRDLTDSKSAGLGSVFPSSVVCHRFADSAIKEPTRFTNVSMGDLRI